MKKTTSSIVLIAGLLLAGASQAAAQQTGASTTPSQTPLGGKLFFNINGGLQTPARTLDKSGTLSIFSQTASWTTSESIPSGGLFDASVGYKVWRDFGVAIGYSYFSKTGAIVGTASVPDPVSFSRPQKQLPINEVAAARIDRNVYVVAMWFFPVHVKIDVALAIGPSFTRVQQDLVVDTQTFRQNIVSAASTLTSIPADVQRQSGTAKGFNVGVDVQYMVTRIIGGGVFVRYNGGSIDLPDALALEVGGFQAGIGARLRF